MIEEKYLPKEYDVAQCDGCKRDLRYPIGDSDESGNNLNYGLLKASFGWPSPLDDVGHGPEYHLCEGCWIKVLAVFNLPVTLRSNGGRDMPDGTEVDDAGEVIGAWDPNRVVEEADKRRRKAE